MFCISCWSVGSAIALLFAEPLGESEGSDNFLVVIGLFTRGITSDGIFGLFASGLGDVVLVLESKK